MYYKISNKIIAELAVRATVMILASGNFDGAKKACDISEICEIYQNIDTPHPIFIDSYLDADEENTFFGSFTDVENLLLTTNHSLRFLEKQKNLKTISVMSQNAVKLWDMSKNPGLKTVVLDCPVLCDLDGFANSSVEDVTVKSYFSPDSVDAFTIVENLHTLKLKYISVKNKENALISFSKCKSLEEIALPRELFTFEQFCWLKSKIPACKGLFAEYDFFKDREKCCYAFSVIGSNMPDHELTDSHDGAQKYIDMQSALVEKYTNQPFPPK